MAGIIAAGDLRIARWENGDFKAFQEMPINCTKFEIKPDGEFKTRMLTQIEKYGQVGGGVGLPKPMSLSIEVDDSDDAEVLGIALMGTVYTEAAATNATPVTDESFVVKELNGYLPLNHTNITNLVVKTQADVVINPSNYKLYPRKTGMILFSGGVTKGETVKLSYSHQAGSNTKIKVMTNSLIKAQVWLDGVNLETGKDFEVKFHRVGFLSKSALNFMSGDFVKTALEGTPETPTGFDSPCDYIKYE